MYFVLCETLEYPDLQRYTSARQKYLSIRNRMWKVILLCPHPSLPLTAGMTWRVDEQKKKWNWSGQILRVNNTWPVPSYTVPFWTGSIGAYGPLSERNVPTFFQRVNARILFGTDLLPFSSLALSVPVSQRVNGFNVAIFCEDCISSSTFYPSCSNFFRSCKRVLFCFLALLEGGIQNRTWPRRLDTLYDCEVCILTEEQNCVTKWVGQQTFACCVLTLWLNECITECNNRF